MNAQYLSVAWSFASTALCNHLWQTTIFAGMAGLLALALRKNRARARYWLWLAASVKFILPFAMLVNIGNHFAWHSSIEPKGQLYSAMEEVTQPFAPSTSPVISSSAPHASFRVSANLLPACLGPRGLPDAWRYFPRGYCAGGGFRRPCAKRSR